MSISLHSIAFETARNTYPALVELTDISKAYGKVQALERITFSIHRGEVLALLGPNGAGKTTIVRLLLGLISPDRGTVKVLGGDPRIHTTRSSIGLLLQAGQLAHTLKVKEHLDLFRSYYPKPLSVEAIEDIAGLSGLMDRRFGVLSAGQKQRVLFALSFCGDPDVVFLDEPSTGMDLEARHRLWEQIRSLARAGKTILLTTHYLEEADALADRLVMLNHGSVVAEGTVHAIKKLHSARIIRCSTSLRGGEILAIDGVESVSGSDARVELRVSAVENVLREMLMRDPGLADLELAGYGLEDAFLALAGKRN